MTMETMPRAANRGDDLTGPLSLGEYDARSVRDTVVIVGAGQNTLHMGESLKNLSEKHPVHVVEVNPPQIPVDPDHLHLVSTLEGRQSAERLLGSGVVHAVYVSLVPRLHKESLVEQLGNAGDGKVDFVVIAKPAVQDIEELRVVDAAMRAAQEKIRLQRGDEPDVEQPSILYVHEHYKQKGAWNTLRERLGEVTDRLGHIRSVTVNIQEARTVEEEGRVDAFAGGALEDLGPHVISLGLDVQSSINTTDRYSIPDRSETSVERFRYEGSTLPEGVETGFVVKGSTQIIDNEQNTAHDLQFTWRGGKGLVDKKEAILEFEHPETGEITIITADLRANTLDVPASVEDLFPETQFEDNGYGYVVEVGLNGGDPSESFQSWKEARTVTKLGYHLARQGRGDAKLHSIGVSLEELEQEAA